jgi:hypothetical protein
VQEGAASRKNVDDQAESTRNTVTSGFDSLRIDQTDQNHHKAVMDSLFFPDIHSRQESIKEAHKETFQWIFETGTPRTRPWSNLIDWLKHGEDIYWISGKAGSGKSTLMNYVVAEGRTTEALKLWTGTRDLFIAKFFFWNAGSALQKSTGGLLRSLLYQILDHRRSLTSVAAQSPIATWTESRLLRTLLDLIQQNLYDDAICFFIDGLDEFQGHQRDLTELLSGLEKMANVKICVSSRPLRAFQISFALSPQLKLEDLTREDIAKLVDDKLRGTSAVTLADTLINRADGVFLWVDLAVKDVLRGVDNEESTDEMEARLAFLPQEIEDLYLHMLKRVEKTYQDSARNYLSLMLVLTPFFDQGKNLLDFALIEYARTDAVITSGLRDSDVEAIATTCRKLRTQIVTRCAGLLELHAPQPEDSEEPEQHTTAYSEIFHSQEKVNFIHRSAYDFLTKDERGTNFLNLTPGLKMQAATQLFKSRLAAFRLLSCPYGVQEQDFKVFDLVSLGREVSDLGGPLDLLLDTMDRLLAEIQGAFVEAKPQDTHIQHHWFISDPADRYWSVPARLAYLEGPHGVTKPTFLAFAAWSGFLDYVCKRLDRLPQVEAKGIVSHMLIIALLRQGRRSEAEMQGVLQLFRCGADVGMVFKVRLEHDVIIYLTPWKAFLDAVLEIKHKQYGKDTVYLDRCSSLANEFLGQLIDPSVSAEFMITKNRAGFLGYGMCTWVSFFINPTVTDAPSLVLSTSPALVLDYLSGSLVDKLPLEIRTVRSRRVSRVMSVKPKKFHDLSEAQSEYLTEAAERCLEYQDSY